MNFLDSFDITRTPTPQPSQQEQPSLNEEVDEVISQLGRFWGGFRKQSQQALEAARKDFGDVVVQAQKELSKLTTTSTDPSSEEATRETDTAASTSIEASTLPPTSPVTLDNSTPLPSSSQTLFSRLQSALPPNVVATVQSHIPESLKHASDTIDLGQLRSNLLSEFQRVQGYTRAQAEEYAHKSEALLREAVKEAGEVLKDAVKVLPPSPSVHVETGSGFVWDGADIWMLPSDSGESSSGKEKATEFTSRSGDAQQAVATRAAALLHRLQRDPSIIQHDPEVDSGVKEQYRAWLEQEVNTTEGGIDGQEWTSKINALLEDEYEGITLRELQDSLVPSAMTNDVFWSRYYFRAYQIKHEEERRKALIQATTESDEDFSWEDEDEEVSTLGNVSSVLALDGKELPENTSARLSAPSSSPRVSSEDSFDVVSSANASVAGDSKPPHATNTEEDGDSDWE